MLNKFLNRLYQKDTYTQNGALSNSTTGASTLDYFAKCGTFRNRELKEVFANLSKMWAEAPYQALRIIFYNRLITRKIAGAQPTEQVQKGQGNRSEFRKSLIWLARYQPDTLYRNLHLVPLVGNWKDLWHEEVVYNLDWEELFALIEDALDDEYQRVLLAKYLPRIRSKANTHTARHLALNAFAHALLRYLKWTPKQYRQFKASGKSHEFQRQMGAQQWEDLDFKRLPGKALFQLVNNTGRDGKSTFQRHGIEDRYTTWIEQQPVAKFTGYVHELVQKCRLGVSKAQRLTLDKQFAGLIQLAKEDGQRIRENVWCALDTSGSMLSPVADTTAYDICMGLGIYFSTLNEGAFKDQVVLFDNDSKVMGLSGSFYDKYLQLTTANTAWGSTNFQSVINEIVRIRKTDPTIPIADFPTTLVVVSDMQFNPVGGNAKTNYEAAMQQLAAVGLPRIRIVWWWVTGRASDFPSTLNDRDVIMIGGFDGSILSLLLGTSQEAPRVESGVNHETGPYAAMVKALDQEILNRLTL